MDFLDIPLPFPGLGVELFDSKTVAVASSLGAVAYWAFKRLKKVLFITIIKVSSRMC